MKQTKIHSGKLRHLSIVREKLGNFPRIFLASLLMFSSRLRARVPTGFIVTGTSLSSHSLLFKQLSKRLKTEINGPNVILRSSDAPNLKAILKQLIRNATNQRSGNGDEEGLSSEQDVCNHEML